MDELMEEIKETLSEIPYIDKLMEINGIGIKTVSCVIAEVGDIGRFDNPKPPKKLMAKIAISHLNGKGYLAIFIAWANIFSSSIF